MTDNVVENIVNEAFGSQEDNSVEAVDTAEVVEAVEEVAEEATQEGAVEEQESNEEVAEDKPVDGEWPKKAVNALANSKKQAAKLRTQNEAMARELSELKSMAESQPKFEGKEPNEDDFETYTDYMDARTKWSVEGGISESQQKQVQDKIKTLEGQHKQAYVQEREAHTASRAEEFKQQTPDFMEVLQATADVQTSPEIDQAFLALDNAPLAYYNLAKEGKLEQLSHMPPEMAKMEIIQAQYRKPAPVQKTKPISAAPKPITSAKGTASTNKPIHQRSTDDVLKWYNQ